VIGMEGDVVTLQDVFRFDYSAGYDANDKALGGLRATGLRPRFIDQLAERNVTVDPALFAALGVVR
jgi:pilus assembly protein CpaF